MPYLNYAPSAWVLPLKFDGGGLSRGRQGDVRQRGQPLGRRQIQGWLAGADALWQGNATKFAPNGQPLSPITTGFTGGGMQGGTFGQRLTLKDKPGSSTYGGKSITVFDKTGKPLTPPEGITFGGQLGLMQGVIVTPSGDVWASGVTKSQLVTSQGRSRRRAGSSARGDERRALQVVHRRRSTSRSTSRTGSG